MGLGIGIATLQSKKLKAVELINSTKSFNLATAESETGAGGKDMLYLPVNQFTAADLAMCTSAEGGTDLPFSIGAYIRPEGLGGHQTLLEHGKGWDGQSGSSYGQVDYKIGINNTNRVIMQIVDANSSSNIAYRSLITDVSVSANTWIHVLCTYDGKGTNAPQDGMTIYINGEAVAASATNSGNITYQSMYNTLGGFSDNAGHISIGGPVALSRGGLVNPAKGGGLQLFRGKMDGVAVWQKEISKRVAYQLFSNKRTSNSANVDLSKAGDGYKPDKLVLYLVAPNSVDGTTEDVEGLSTVTSVYADEIACTNATAFQAQSSIEVTQNWASANVGSCYLSKGNYYRNFTETFDVSTFNAIVPSGATFVQTATNGGNAMLSGTTFKNDANLT